MMGDGGLGGARALQLGPQVVGNSLVCSYELTLAATENGYIYRGASWAAISTPTIHLPSCIWGQDTKFEITSKLNVQGKHL